LLGGGSVVDHRRLCCLRLGLGRRLCHRSLFSCLVSLLFVSHLYLSVLAAVACRSVCTVKMRAISRLVSLRRAEFSSAPVTDWKRRLKSSWRRSVSRWSSSSSESSRNSLGLVKEISLSLHDF